MASDREEILSSISLRSLIFRSAPTIICPSPPGDSINIALSEQGISWPSLFFNTTSKSSTRLSARRRSISFFLISGVAYISFALVSSSSCREYFIICFIDWLISSISPSSAVSKYTSGKLLTIPRYLASLLFRLSVCRLTIRRSLRFQNQTRKNAKSKTAAPTPI